MLIPGKERGRSNKSWLRQGWRWPRTNAHLSISQRGQAQRQWAWRALATEALGHLISGRGWRRGTVMLIRKGCSSETRQNGNELLLYHRLVPVNRSLFLRFFVFVLSFEGFISVSFQICPWILNKGKKGLPLQRPSFPCNTLVAGKTLGDMVCLLIHSFMHIFLHSL